jgi:outer membrane lipoprotein
MFTMIPGKKYMLAAGAMMFLLLPACAPPFPKALMARVDRSLPAADLMKDPDQYRGRMVMLGGVIVAIKNLQTGTQIEVVQKPLDSEGRPEQTDETAGRFLLQSPRFYDTAVFQRGRLITVVGEIAGQRVLPLGEIEYRYPLINASAVHLWSPYSGPRVSIGIGVYRGI